MVTKAKGLKGRRVKAKAKGRSSLPRPKMLLRRRKQRLRLRELIPRPRMFLLLSQAKRKILLPLLLKLSP